MKKTVKRLALLLVIAELAYLVVVNLVLNLPLTQTLINQHRPEKYAVRWQSAWSWFPLRAHASGISANGQTSSQQWQVQVTSASASVAILPLLQRTVEIYAADAENVDFRLRPRPKPGKDYAAIRDFFPPIDGRDPNSAAVAKAPRKAGKAWQIVVNNGHAHGEHSFWIFQLRGVVAGDLYADVRHETRGGPLAVNNGKADIKLQTLTLNRDWEVSRNGTVKSEFAMAPFVPAEHRGLKALAFLTLDAEVNAPVDSLDFLNFYLRGTNGLELDGKGELAGRLHYDKGSLLPGSDMAVAATELALKATPFTVKGDGKVNLSVAEATPEVLSISTGFQILDAFHDQELQLMFTGESLQVDIQGPAGILDFAKQQGQRRVVVSIPEMSVPDLQVYQAFLPDKWPFRLLGGNGKLTGQGELTAQSLSAELKLLSENADVAFKDFRFRSNLDTSIKVSGGAGQTTTLELSNSYLRLDDARLQGGQEEVSKPWRTDFIIDKGALELVLPDEQQQETDFAALLKALRENKLKTLLASASAALETKISVSDLSWINLLFSNPFQLAVSGSGEVAAKVNIESGWLAEGTALQVQPHDLRISILDYVATGDGGVALRVERGGEYPDMTLDAGISNASLKRRGEKKAVVERVELNLAATAHKVSLAKDRKKRQGSAVRVLSLQIPSAKVTDMSVYNQFLPPGAPLKLLGGEADLSAEIRLEPEDAKGYIRLKTSRLKSRLDEQMISGLLDLDIKLQDGVPKDMSFDISGSSLSLNGFKVSGDETSFDQPGWQARFDLNKASAVWKKPVQLQLEAGLRMQDTRPIVAMFANQRGKHGWLEKLLTVEDVKGKVKLAIKSGQLLVPYAAAGSDKIDIGAKTLIEKDNREGIVYARYRKLKGILKIKNGKQNFDILGAEKKFKAYAPGVEPLALRSSLLAPPEDDTTGQDNNNNENQAEPASDSEPESPKKENKLTKILKKPLSIFRNKP